MARIDQMWQMRQSGATLHAIGHAFGISRQRVHSLLREGCGSTAIISRLTGPQLAELAGCQVNYITKLRRRGVIQPEVVPGRKWRLWGRDSPGKVIAYQRRHPEVCQWCGRPRPSQHQRYCSARCRSQARLARRRVKPGNGS